MFRSIFFALLFYAISSGGLYQGLIISIFYAVGMGLPLVLITILVAKTNELILEKITQTLFLKRLSGIILTIVGVYLGMMGYLSF